MPGVMGTSEMGPFRLNDLTEEISDGCSVICRGAGFSLNKVEYKNRKATVLLKLFSNLHPGIISSYEISHINQNYEGDMQIWADNCSSKHFVTILGRCTDSESFAPCPIYKETILMEHFIRTLPDKQIVIFYHIAQGIAEMHRKGIIHGDLRADNILVDDDGMPRISDYSLTRIIAHLDHFRKRAATEVCGGIRWMPIEEVKLEDDVPRVPTKPGDIWSFGMTIFELWSGLVPYHNIPIERVARKIEKGGLPSVDDVKTDNQSIKEVIRFLTMECCWKTQPESRVTAEELAIILEKLFKGASIDQVRRDHTVRESYPSSSSRRGPFIHTSPATMSSSFPTITGSNVHIEDVRDPLNPSGSRRRSNNGDFSGSGINNWRAEVDTASSPSATSRGSSSVGTYRDFGNRRALLRPLWEYPPPPSPVSSNVLSKRTILENFRNKESTANLNIEHSKTGTDNNPTWTTTITMNGRVIAEADAKQKKKADDEAAEAALLVVENDYPGSLSPYLPIFKKYIDQNDLQNRVQYRFESHGEAHILNWVCRIICDEREIAQGEASSKKLAEERAVRAAYNSWPGRRLSS